MLTFADIKEKIKESNKEKEIPDYISFFEENKQGGNIVQRLLKRLLKTNLKEFILSTLLFIIKNCGAWSIPIITANVINIATAPDQHSQSALFINGGVLCILIMQNIFTHVWYATYTSRMLRNIGVGLRNSLIKKLQQLSISFHKELRSGELQSKFLHDIETIENFLNQLIMSLIPNIITAIVTISITLYKSRIVSLFFVVIIPLNVVLVYLFRKKIRKTNRIFRRETETISGKITTMIEMIPVTKAHGLEATESKHLEKNLENLKHAGTALDHANAQFGSLVWVVSTTLSAVCLVFTGFFAYHGKISVGNVVLFQSYFNMISGSIQALINIFPEFSKGAESINSISEIMLSDDIEDNRNKIRLRYVHGTVEFKNVSYRYPHTDKDVIRNFSLDVEPGECIAFVGGSGSGKSTIMNMIIGFLNATKGEVLIDGKPIEKLNLQSYRQFLAVVPQNSILFPGTIRENIVYGLAHYSEEELQKAVKMSNIDEFLTDLPDGIDTEIGEHGGNLSGGQKQRISIARALIRDPKIIILDEATSALDNISELHVQKAMENLAESRTTFIVAHRLSTIRNADRICVMENGSCVECGTHDELMKKRGKFYDLEMLNEQSE